MICRRSFAAALAAFLLFQCRFAGKNQSSLSDLPTTAPAVTAMFHPVDPTLETIAEAFRRDYARVDIALYNLDVKDTSPIVRALKTDEVRARLTSGQLKVRMIFEGYGSPCENATKSAAVEALGVDVVWLRGGRKVHHKFAVFSQGSSPSLVATGSANWSLKSRKQYDENILLIEGAPSITYKFQAEFSKLWSASEEFRATCSPDSDTDPDPDPDPDDAPLGDFQVTGKDFGHPLNPAGDPPVDDPGLDALFNSAHFDFQRGTVRLLKSNREAYTLTRNIVDALDQAKKSIKIASTRINLRPAYEALVRAASRGVSIEILVNQDQYKSDYSSSRKTFKGCSSNPPSDAQKACCDRDGGTESAVFDPYEPKCSTGQIFAFWLGKNDYEGKGNVDVRVKFFNINPTRYLTNQMHSKYVIIDDNLVFSGSFNLSHSSEYNHLENVVVIDARWYPEVIERFTANFANIFSQGRNAFLTQWQPAFEQAHADKSKVCCRFRAALTYQEIDRLLDTRRRHKKWRTIRNACRPSRECRSFDWNQPL